MIISVAKREIVCWQEAGHERSAFWLSDGRAVPPPAKIVTGDDSMKADAAYRLACEGTAIVWRGDFENAKLLLRAMARRLDRRRVGRDGKQSQCPANAEAFHRYRMARAQRARILGMLLLEVEAGYSLPLRRAPQLEPALTEAFGPAESTVLVPLPTVLGAIGAHQWRKKGVWVPALGARIHPHYGVFAPIRSEHVELVEKPPLPDKELAFDIGTGTGVLAAVLAKRGVRRVVATDNSPQAVACATENIERLGLSEQVDVMEANLYPPIEIAPQASLVVCNPPWIPSKATTTLEQAVYDPKSMMLRGFLRALPKRLEPGGEAWLIMSDLAEHLGLRKRGGLVQIFQKARLKVLEKIDARPSHPRIRDKVDPLHAARKLERTSLWRLVRMD